MKVSGSIALIEVDLSLFKKHFKEDMSKNVLDATKVWLREAEGKVPVLTGMAKGSLLDVAAVSDTHLVISPRGKRNRISKGRALGTATPKYGPKIYRMTIKSRVEHYVLLEDEAGGSKTSPWKSFDAGIMAVENFEPKLRTVPVSVTKRTI